MNFERQFDATGRRNFVGEYASGRTPLPCAHCNADLKFATLADRARAFDADRVATGHYARVDRDEAAGRYLLKRGIDSTKDQAYFLFSLTQDQLAQACFPVGDRAKDAVRDYARRAWAASRRQAGQPGDLFHPGRRLRRVRDVAGAGCGAAGFIVDERGRELGRHSGIHRFTVGQRKGLGLSSSPNGKPLYVLALNPADGQVVVGPRHSLERRTLTASRRELDHRRAVCAGPRRGPDPPPASAGSRHGSFARRRPG